MVRTAALSLAILLGGCDEIPHAWTRQEVIDISRANAAGQSGTSEVERRLGAVEIEVAQLRREHEQDANLIARLTKANVEHDRYSTDAFDRLFKNDETFRLNVNALRAAQGWQPIPTADSPTKK